MYDLSSFSLPALLNISTESSLVESYRMTDWVVVLNVDGRELVMNHGSAHIFLQGLLFGAAMRSRERNSGHDVGDAWTHATPASRVVIG